MKEENPLRNSIIRNREQLLSAGNTFGRRIVLDIIEHSLQSIDTYEAARKLISLEGEVLSIGNLHFDLAIRGDIYVLGAGKASFPIAKALEDILGNRIKGGIVIEKREGALEHLEVIKAGHPIPDERGFRGAQEIMELAHSMEEGDLVFCLFTGGSSALMTLPAGNIVLKDVQTVTDLLLKSGAAIKEINAVRKHISAIKGGRLAAAIHPAGIVNLTVSDVIGDWECLDVITCPTVPDTSTFSDAVCVLKKYNLWDETPAAVRDHLLTAAPEHETPKDFTGIDVCTFILSTNKDLCSAAKKRAEELGFHTAVLSTMIEGESRDVGTVLAGIAREIEKRNSPFPKPVVLISGGETTVTIRDEPGEGGPNQEFVLGFSLAIRGSKSITGAALGTDGTDGPTDIAGGIADGYTGERAEEKAIDIFESLVQHNASHVLRELGDAIYTGGTGTNVMDFRLILVQSTSRGNSDEQDRTDEG